METECPICMDTLETKNVVIINCCKKQLHLDCYTKCTALKPECPFCRRPVEVVIDIPESEVDPHCLVLLARSLPGLLLLSGMSYYLFTIFYK